MDIKEMTDIGAYYDRKAIERRAVVEAFAKVRAISGVNPTADRLLASMCKVEAEAGDTGD
jgi:hypothetical protein